MPTTIIELLLQIVLEAMRGQTPEQREKIWQWYIDDMTRWRKILHLDD